MCIRFIILLRTDALRLPSPIRTRRRQRPRNRAGDRTAPRSEPTALAPNRCHEGGLPSFAGPDCAAACWAVGAARAHQLGDPRLGVLVRSPRSLVPGPFHNGHHVRRP
jgi:hypothetical protein